jgi:hypothetical protein
MTIIAGYFDDIHYPESKIESFEIGKDSIIVNIKKGLAIYPPHPLAYILKFDEPCRIIFKCISYSKRIFNEYRDDQPKGFLRHEFINEFDNFDPNLQYQEYVIEGLYIEPMGWIEWDITAAEFYVDDLKG